MNCTYFDALGQREEEYLIARAIQFFAPGIPQVYYVGLLAGANDLDLLTPHWRRTRHQSPLLHAQAEIDNQLYRARWCRRLLELIRFRNSHPAFAGEFHLADLARIRRSRSNGETTATGLGSKSSSETPCPRTIVCSAERW